MRLVGLTGSIGMGKSTVAAMFRRLGVPVFDADAAVHVLQGPGGRLLPAIEARFPGTTSAAGVDRTTLGALVLGNPSELKALERIVHPAVGAMRAGFLRRYRACAFVILDVPLLFETRGDRAMAQVVVVSAPPFVQRRRVLRRPGMTEQRFRQIVSRQVPDHIKRRRADFLIPTARPLWRTYADVRRVVACLARSGARY